MTARETLCLVDDDVFVRDALANGLRELGYNVRLAPGAVAALDVIERNGVDLIVTDIAMPGTSGLDFMLEARARWPAMPIIAISGLRELNGAPIAEVARKLGADVLLAKPFRARDLATLIGEVMGRRASA